MHSWKEIWKLLIKWLKLLESRWLKKIKLSPENISLRLLWLNGSMLLIHYLKWWSVTYLHQEKLKSTEPPTCTKVLKMTPSLNQWENATPKDPSLCSSQRWSPPLIEVDSSLSDVSSLVPSPLDKKLESLDQTTNQERRKTLMKRQSRELCWWWVEPLNILLMSHAVTLLVLLVLINTSWKPVPSLTTLMLTPSEVWSTQSPLSSELLSKPKTHKISPSLLMVLRNSQSLIH